MNSAAPAARPLPPDASPDAAPVGLLIVHDIGSQKRGETLDGFLGGMRLAYGAALNVERVAPDHAKLSGVGRPVHAYEVHWADLLEGEVVRNLFNFERVFETVWFPRFQLAHGWLRPEVVSRGRVRVWLCLLVPLSPFLYFGYYGAQFLGSLFDPLVRLFRPSKTPASAAAPPPPDTWRARLRDAAKGGRRSTVFDELMDEIPGDVFNYVAGSIGSFSTSERGVWLTKNIAEIHERFAAAAARARQDGCRELQVLAHSLGTVVAFRGMCPAARPAAADETPTAPAALSRLYTIGSPLEKFRFFWTALVEAPHAGPAIVHDGRTVAATAAEAPLRWDNFFNRLDLVSGKLRAFPGWPAPENHPARGLGGLVSAHVAYHSNRDFLERIGEGLTGVRPDIRIGWRRKIAGRIRAGFESLLLPVVFSLFALLGLAVVITLFWGVGWLLGWPFKWFDLEAWARGVGYYFVGAALVAALIGLPYGGYARVQDAYAKHWAKKNSAPPD